MPLRRRGGGGAGGRRARHRSGRRPPAALGVVPVRHHRDVRSDAGGAGGPALRSDPRPLRRRPSDRGADDEPAGAARGDARRLRPRAGAVEPRPRDARGTRPQRRRGVHVAGLVRGRPPRRRPGRGGAAPSPGLEALSEMGETYLLSTVAAELARAVVLQGRDAEAEALTATAEELAAEDDIASQALWRSVRATVMARRGELRAARRMATEAVELLRRTDAAVTLADALVDLGGGVERCGDMAMAHDAFEEALLLFEHKGNVVAAASARDALARTGAATA